MKIFKFFMVCSLVASCNVAERVERSLPDKIVISPDLIQGTLGAASARHPENKTLFDASVAQVGFAVARL